MNFIIFIALVFAGMLLFWYWESHKYIHSGTFKWSKWKKDNLTASIWTLGLAVILSTIIFFAPESTALVFKFLGINIAEYIDGGDFSLSGAIIGVLITMAVKRKLKPKKEETE